MQPSLRQLFRAVLYALLGISTEQQRALDFSQRSVLPYLLVGVLCTSLFVLGLLLLVRWVLSGT